MNSFYEQCCPHFSKKFPLNDLENLCEAKYLTSVANMQNQYYLNEKIYFKVFIVHWDLIANFSAKKYNS